MVVNKEVLKIKVMTKSKSNEIIGWKDDVLKIKITAVPEKGKANIAVVKLIAHILQIPISDMQIISGFTASKKKILLDHKHILTLRNLYI